MSLWHIVDLVVLLLHRVHLSLLATAVVAELALEAGYVETIYGVVLIHALPKYTSVVDDWDSEVSWALLLSEVGSDVAEREKASVEKW